MTEPDLHSEPFIHLVDLDHERVLIAWGSFCFRRHGPGHPWLIVDDEQLHQVAQRHTCIGAEAEPFGQAHVQVFDRDGSVVAEAKTADTAWVWVDGLRPDTEYRYRVTVDGEEWAAGERWDWAPHERGGYDLAPAGRTYDLRFRTWPEPDADTPPLRFVALGDYGVGIRSDSESSRRQRRIAEVLDHVVTHDDVRFVVSLGDNVYVGEEGQVDQESGGEDDDWYSSFFQPYRYTIARVPVFPAIGNHDTTDSEGADDRAQMEDNFHLRERFPDQFQDGGTTATAGLFYRRRYGKDLEIVCLDTSQAAEHDDVHRLFQADGSQAWLRRVFSTSDVTWRIPFSHHPVYCAGPKHLNDDDMCEVILPLFAQGGVRLALAGHEHNFQLNEVDGRTYVVSGAGGKVRDESPEDFARSGTKAWAAHAHLLLIDIDGDEARLTPVSGFLPDGGLHRMTALNERNETVLPPFVVQR